MDENERVSSHILFSKRSRLLYGIHTCVYNRLYGINAVVELRVYKNRKGDIFHHRRGRKASKILCQLSWDWLTYPCSVGTLLFITVLLSAAFVRSLYFVVKRRCLRPESSSLLAIVTVLLSAAFIQTSSLVFEFRLFCLASMSLLSAVFFLSPSFQRDRFWYPPSSFNLNLPYSSVVNSFESLFVVCCQGVFRLSFLLVLCFSLCRRRSCGALCLYDFGCPFFSFSVCLCIVVRCVVLYVCTVRVRVLFLCRVIVLFMREKMRVLFLFQR